MHFSDVEVGKQLIVGNGAYYNALSKGKSFFGLLWKNKEKDPSTPTQANTHQNVRN